MKAISSVISTILMLMVTMAIAGTAYMYISGVFTRQTATSFSISYSYGNNIVISNDGTNPITQFTKVTVDDVPVEYTIIPQDTSLVGYWKFDEALGRAAADSSGKGNNGNFSGETFNDGIIYGAVRTSGKFGSALSFDGIDDYVEIPDSPSIHFSLPFTVEFWVQLTENKNWLAITKGGAVFGGWYVYMDDSNSVRGTYYDSVGTRYDASASVNLLNTWVHVAVVYQEVGKPIIIYINGVLSGTPSANLASGTYNTANILLARYTDGSYSLKGLLDELRIYNRSLSQSEIQADMNSYRPMNRTVAAWSFEESGQYANDTHIWVKGKYGSAISFDGSNDYVNITNSSSLNINSQITIASWIKPSEQKDWETIIERRWENPGSFWLGMNASSILFALKNDANIRVDANYPITLTANQWYFVAATYDGSAMTVYVDGQPGTPTAQTGTFSNFGNYTIGLHPTAYGVGGSWFNGTIDEAMIFNHVLSPDEIRAIYNIGSMIKPGTTATMKIFNTLSQGMHTVRACTPSMCRIGYLTVI